MKKITTAVFVLFSLSLVAQIKYDPLKITRKKFSLLVFVPNKLFYEKESVKLSESDKYNLGVIANGLLQNKDLKVQIKVFYDTTLDPEASKNITQKRAEAIKNYLVVCGVNPDNLIAKGYGDTVIINKCKPFVKCTEAEHAVNRRVELVIVNPEKLEHYKMVKK